MKIPESGTMEDGPNSAPHNGQLGPSGVGTSSSSVKVNNSDDNNPRLQYSIPGILHFIQHEWARFEMERSQWEVERAELQARIAFLQGERKGQENLKNDLVRRIKMLEYALKQERAKYHKLKYGTELQQGDVKPPIFEDGIGGEPVDGESIFITNSNVNWRQGRQLLRQYLQEIGYTDTIIDVRSNRVRSLLGLNPAGAAAEKEEQTGGGAINGGASNSGVSGSSGSSAGAGSSPGDPSGNSKRLSETQGRRAPAKKVPPASLAEAMIMDTEAAVMANFDFLAQEGVGVEVDDEDDMSDEMEDNTDDDADDTANASNAATSKRNKMKAKNLRDDVDAETEEVLNEFSFLGSDTDDASHELRVQTDTTDWDRGRLTTSDEDSEWSMDPLHISQLKELYRRDRAKNKRGNVSRFSGGNSGGVPRRPVVPAPVTGPTPVGIGVGGETAHLGGLAGLSSSDDEGVDGHLGLGELAQLTVNNEAEVSYDISVNKESFRKTWNAKYTLRSHFDGVRALAFHPIEPVLVTASEDCTLKLWNLQKTIPAKKSASLDVEPVYTFRGHTGPVLCLAMSSTGEQCFSGGLDGSLQCWNIPGSNIDPYDSYDPSVLSNSLLGHTDAVWGLSLHSQKLHLLSSSADGSVRLWNPQSKSPLLSVFTSESDGIPTSVDFVRDDLNRMVTSYNSAACILFDLETGQPVTRLDTDKGVEDSVFGRQINRVISHPTLPLTITAHEDRHIRFYDNNTGKLAHAMVAHLDAVTCLAVDPNGLYLLSGSHDCSIRLWNLENKTCVQEITSHRKKFDESIFDVAFHPSKPFIASAGADALAKVFV
ncbi:striatin-like isoform X2 [Daphnia pulicaria]|uniref:striatin-like isoform X2 n=1 Tax=Daphnia pulicaria TaxID=35523 RepID=UPI001EEA7F51|nr:striatin-like isoform X2 [Daphnia pulicaria]